MSSSSTAGCKFVGMLGISLYIFFSPPLAVSRILNVNSEEKVKVQLFLGEMWPKCLEFMRQLMEVYICT